MEFKTVRVEIPDGANVILGQTHFIKTAEDLYEILAGSSPHIKFGVAFTEASGPCLIRHEGNDAGLTKAAVGILQNIGAGHVFATANPLEVVVAETEQGRGIMGVVDGSSPKGVEQDSDRAARKEMLRKFGYKVK